jgi:Protein of unknown function (DUF2905)
VQTAAAVHDCVMLPRMQRFLIAIGLLIALVGVLWPWITKLGLGRLPGDLRIDKPGFTLYAPFTTMIIVSVVLSLVIWLLRR